MLLRQASLLFCFFLSFTLATLSSHAWRTFVILSINSFLHLLLDATQIKWANGVHFFAPFSWQLTNFNVFWPESLPTYVLTIFGLIYVAVNWRKNFVPSEILIPRAVLRICSFVFLVAAYFVLPFFLLHWSQVADNHYVKTLRDVESRPGNYVEFDRVRYMPGNDGGVLVTFAKEEIDVAGMKLEKTATVSVRGSFIDNKSVSVSEYHIHSDWFRNVGSYTGLALVAVVWVVALIRNWEFVTISRTE